ncbi:HU family DNA-binding protein [Streptomyces andamanensis]|uniref:HU family DNA-binding protein n=1 Tax=Streptomyces andamanensis TaxID=1565035 RepID=A0ABV8TCC1_9ACTN
MNKNQLIAALSDRTGATLKDTQAFVDAFVGCVENTVATGDKVVLPGFGTFEARDVAAREGVDPSTGQRRLFPATRRASFKVGATFKEKVKGEQPVPSSGKQS